MPKKQKTPASNENSNGSAKPRRTKSTTAKKTGAPKNASARKSKPTKASIETLPHPTDEEIRLRAYFIAERRHRLDLPGDADSDWLEAKRQLVSELGAR